MASTSWNGRKLWLKSQISIMRINALVRTAAIPLPGVDFWHIFETQVLHRKLDQSFHIKRLETGLEAVHRYTDPESWEGTGLRGCVRE